MITKSLMRLKELIKKTGSYEAFERKATAYPHWYLEGLQMWTKRDLRQFYDRFKGGY